jgi:CBS-domain-containing membrane protein
LKGRTVGEIVNRDVRGVAQTTPITQALAVMIEWGYTQVPVINEQGRLVGMFGHQEILQAAAQQSTSAEQGEVRVRMVMQAATARVALGQSLAAALEILITAPGHMVFAVDDQQRLVGVLRLTRVLSYVQGDERKLLLAVLRRAQPMPVTALPGARQTIDELVEPSLPAVALDAGLSLAAQQLLAHQAERLPVVDPDGRLSGIIARGALIRALLQQ